MDPRWPVTFVALLTLVPLRAAAQTPAAPKPRFMGAGSCASMSCHNEQGPPGALRSEYTTWASFATGDKHARAYETLLSERSRTIARNLEQALGRKVVAHQDAVCLNCHVLPNHDVAEKEDRIAARHFKLDGVSCESCHGPAEKWLPEHHRASWQALTPAQKTDRGMWDTKTLVGRARGCAECHIGSAPGKKGGIGQDVYHDLYAAGHPPLVYEFASYHAALPHHWQDAKDKDPRAGGKPDFEARAWLAGQLASADAALALLAHRAADDKRPWPEFAEYSCYACHRTLTGQATVSLKRLGKRKPGTAPFRSLYIDLVPLAAKTLTRKDDDALADVLRSLREEMEEMSDNRPRVIELTSQARARVRHYLMQADPKDIETNRLDDVFMDRKGVPASATWDDAVQQYAALAALQRTWDDVGKTPAHAAGLRSLLSEWRSNLGLPAAVRSRFDVAEWQNRLGRGEK